jgi:hypothetical protein
MTPRLGVDLEIGTQIARVLPELDLLDIAYGAVRGGAQVIMVPVSAFVTSSTYGPDLFNRPGLPLFALKAEADDLDRLPGLGVAPDRILITGDRGKPVTDVGKVADVLTRVVGAGQETGMLIEPEPAMLKDLSRAKVQWAYFSTEPAYHALSLEEAETELARLQSAMLAARHVNLRVALFGATGRHLPAAFAALPNLEEIYPAPDLWGMALRLGWEGAVAEYRHLLR